MRKISRILKENDLGDMGIGAMIIFIEVVLVAGIAASVLIQTANRLEIQAMQTGQETIGEVSSGLQIIDIFDANGPVICGSLDIQGQVMDMAAEAVDYDLHSITRLQQLKTGALLAASIEMGAILGRVPPEGRAHLRAYARDIGLAFQDFLAKPFYHLGFGRVGHAERKAKREPDERDEHELSDDHRCERFPHRDERAANRPVRLWPI